MNVDTYELLLSFFETGTLVNPVAFYLRFTVIFVTFQGVNKKWSFSLITAVIVFAVLLCLQIVCRTEFNFEEVNESVPSLQN